MLRFFLGWIADLESYLLMQKYSQGASKEASTQAAQNRAQCWTLSRGEARLWGLPRPACGGLYPCSFPRLGKCTL